MPTFRVHPSVRPCPQKTCGNLRLDLLLYLQPQTTRLDSTHSVVQFSNFLYKVPNPVMDDDDVGIGQMIENPPQERVVETRDDNLGLECKE
jgi:hypothetical protein